MVWKVQVKLWTAYSKAPRNTGVRLRSFRYLPASHSRYAPPCYKQFITWLRPSGFWKSTYWRMSSYCNRCAPSEYWILLFWVNYWRISSYCNRCAPSELLIIVFWVNICRFCDFLLNCGVPLMKIGQQGRTPRFFFEKRNCFVLEQTNQASLGTKCHDKS